MTLQPLRTLTIIGGGSWATALVKIFSESGIIVTWHLRSEDHVKFLLENGRNPNYLSFFQLDMQYIRPTHLLEDALAASDDVLFVVPSAYLETTVSGLDENSLKGKRLYVSIKGLVTDQFMLPSVFIAGQFNTDAKDITVLAGPCHAEEIVMDRKTYLTISGENKEVVNRITKAVKSSYIQVIKNNDPLGVEYAAILKNVVGIASGIVKGLNYGDNFLAVIISNAMREIKDFLKVADQSKRDLNDSVYFGDLLVTAYSEYSRNRSFGSMIGRGYSVAIAESRMNMIAEGFPAVKGMHQTATELRVNMPVLSTVYRILYAHASPFMEFKLLENRLK